MELSERNIQKLEDEGYTSVYEWFDEPGKTYVPHKHETKQTILISEGSMLVSMHEHTNTYASGDRLDIPAGVTHTVTVGPEGCKYVIGE